MTETKAESQPAPVIFLLTDNKPGHANQLKGLGNRLRVLCGASIHWIDTTTIKTPLWRAVLGVAPALDNTLPTPNLIIGAGTGTHRLLLALRRKPKARTVVLMRPAFPLSWVDAAIIPEHDRAKPARTTLVTEGVINTLTPMARMTDKPEALVLIGGPSRHYNWDDNAIFNQLVQLLKAYPDWRWTISGSRRTPEALQQRLAELAGLKVTVADSDRTHADWLPQTLAASRAVWVTPDSSSMVFEAVTAGLTTGVFELTARANSRVANSVTALIERGRVAPYSDHAAVMDTDRKSSAPLWEADRAARWLIKQFPAGKRR